MRTSALLLFSAAVLACAPAHGGGWFKVYAFKGTLGKYPITLSFQMTGEDSKGGSVPGKRCLNLTGLYKYDKVNEMIPLQGEIVWKTRRVVLEELRPGRGLGSAAPPESALARFEFEFGKGSIQGTWKSLKGPKAYPLRLEYVSSLIDTFNIYQDSTEKSGGQIGIPMYSTAPDRYFAGVYEYDYLKYRIPGAVMRFIDVFEKKTGRLIQRIEVPLDEYSSLGTYNTIIYENAGYWDGQLGIVANGGKSDFILRYRWDRKKSRYLPMPEE